MIYFARSLSLIGGVVTLLCVLALFVLVSMRHLLPPEILSHWEMIFAVMMGSAALLFIGQKLGNDLFSLTGKNSVFRQGDGRDSRNGGVFHASDDFGHFGD